MKGAVCMTFFAFFGVFFAVATVATTTIITFFPLDFQDQCPNSITYCQCYDDVKDDFLYHIGNNKDLQK